MSPAAEDQTIGSNMELSATEEHFRVCFVIGAPGAGKGTLCAKLAEDFSVYHLSTGDYLRQLNTSDPSFPSPNITDSIDLDHFLQQRKLLPATIIVPILAQKIAVERLQGHNFFLIDGFPRDEASAALFEHTVTKPYAVIFFDCPKEVAQSRFLNRARGDDDVEVFTRRYAEFERNNAPILRRYQGVVTVIDTSQATHISYRGLFEVFSALT